MKKCKYCAEEIQDEAVVCRHCGKDQVPIEEKKQDDKKKKGGARVIVVVAVIIIVLCVIVFIVAGTQTDGDEPKETHSELGAWVVCQLFVEENLKSPSTAKYPAGYSQYTEDLGDGRYRIKAYVDSENAFGAMIRNEFICEVKHQSEDQYQLELLEFVD